MFKIIENKRIENFEIEYSYLLVHNGFTVDNVGAKEVEVWNSSKSKFDKSYEIEALEDRSQFLGNFPISAFREGSKLYLFGWNNFEDFNIDLELYINEGFEKYFVDFHIIPNLSSWKRQYSFAEYTKAFHSILQDKISKYEFLLSNKIYDKFTKLKLTISHKFEGNPINQELEDYKSLILIVHNKVTEQFNHKSKVTFVLTSFEFPEMLKTSCEQYLLYFAQFLQDLGINAISNLKEEAGRVLFSVTPTDDVEALDKIREALAVYLNLPSSPIVYDESFAAMRIKQQVDNLQHSQRMIEMEFRMSQTVIESQDKIIQQKDSTFEQQSKIIEKITDKAVMINSAENKEELEELFDGVKVGKSKFLAEQVGLHLNPATALKAVGKKLIGQEDDLISLNLNDEMEDKIIER